MKSIFELCKPREEVFVDVQQNDALDLSNLSDDTIDKELFFEETYFTDGMRQLIDMAFQRFAGKGGRGLVRLKQAMGGGKTHNMIALGMLAKYPEMRRKVDANIIHNFDKPVKVISFTGRESDTPYGIWGEIAKQLGKLSDFNSYYSPLSAPGQSAWINLLKGDPILILLDELPPYLTYLKTRALGTGTLAEVTVTALSNLFNAVSKSELSNVCVVVSDLNATYESGSDLLQRSFKDLDGEISRTAMNIEPVRASSDDLYLILKKKLFSKLPSEQEIIEVATEYKNAVNKAKQMNYTGTDANSIYQGICEVYPFHPCIKDLFARFKENVNFQQTRGFIRLGRLMVRSLFKNNGEPAKTKYLINAYDYDLNDILTCSTITNIKPKMTNAISHDICGEGRAAAEIIDAGDKDNNMQEIAKMILTASLGDVTGVLLGLTANEIIGNMVAPGRDMSNFRNLINLFFEKAWYLYSDKDGRLYFRDVKNVNAELNNLVSSFNKEQAKQEIKKILQARFAPQLKDCYQKVLVFPAVDEIQLAKNQITLVLFEPNVGGGLPESLQTFFKNCDYPNRLMFLSGQKDTMDSLLDAAKEQKGIQSILRNYRDEGLQENDTQYILANDLANRIAMKINSAMNETFVTLYYPAKPEQNQDFGGRGYRSHEIIMNFENNDFNPEEQVRKLLIEIGKFTEENKTKEDIFRKKIEERIFTANQMRWQDVQERAATNTQWNWYYPSALDDTKNRCIANGYWTENGDMVDKAPPKPKTSVTVREISKNAENGTVTLKLVPQNGTVIHWEVGRNVTTASSVVKDQAAFLTSEMVLSFLCVDPSGQHETGDKVVWQNKVTVQYKPYDANGKKYYELMASNSKVEILYSTDGSNPREGAVYREPFAIDSSMPLIQAVAYYRQENLYGEELKFKPDYGTTPSTHPNGGQVSKVSEEIPNEKPVIVNGLKLTDTNDVYKFLEEMKQFRLNAVVSSIYVGNSANSNTYIDLNVSGLTWSDELLTTVLDVFRTRLMGSSDTNVSVTFEKVNFNCGSDFKQWVATRKEEISKYNYKVEEGLF